MTRKDEILKAALDYANHQKDIPIKDEFTKLLCTALGQAFRDGAMWADETRQNEVKPLFKVGDKVCQKKDRDFVVIINSITNGLYLCDVYDKDGDYDDDYCFSVSEQDQWELVDKCQGCNNKKGCVTCHNGDQYAHIEEPEQEGNRIIKRDANGRYESVSMELYADEFVFRNPEIHIDMGAYMEGFGFEELLEGHTEHDDITLIVEVKIKKA